MIFGPKNSARKTLIAIISSEQAEVEIRSLMKGSKDFRVTIKKTDDVYKDGRSLVNGSADVVIVEADAEDPRSEDVLRELCEYVSLDGAMIVISNEPNVQTVRKLFKIGVNDVLPLPLNANDFYNSIKAASEVERSQTKVLKRSKGKVIAVTKANGGVGSTTVSLNLARRLMTSDSFKRSDNRDVRVAVFDFNVQFGAAALNLNLKSRANLFTVLQAENRLDEDLLYASIVKHESGISVLAAPTEIVPANAFSVEFMESLIDHAISIFDYIVIDMPLMWTDWTPGVLQRSDAIVSVLHPLVEHVHNLSRLFDGLDRLDIEKARSMIVLNELGKGPVFKERADQIQKRFSRSTVMRRKDEAIHKVSADRGVLLEKASGNKVAMRELDNLCVELKTLLDRFEGASSMSLPQADDVPDYLRAET